MLGLLFIFAASRLTCGVTGNTSDSGSEESRFEPWQVNKIINHLQIYFVGDFFCS